MLFYNKILPKIRFIDVGAATIGGTAISSGMSAVTGPFTAYLQHKYAKEDRAENFTYQEMAARAADMRQRKQWEDMYSFSAQMRELEKAGLSPSLMFSGNMPGAGGSATGQQGGGAQGPVTGSLSPIADFSAFASLGPALAQVEKSQADARLANTQADALEGKNAAGLAAIAKDWADAGLKDAAKNLTELNAQMEAIEIALKNDNFEELSNEIKSRSNFMSFLAQKTHSEALSADLTFQFENETYQNHVQQVQVQVQNIIADTYLKYAQTLLAKSNINLNNQQIAALKNQMYVNLQSLILRSQELDFSYDKLNSDIDMFNSNLIKDLQQFDKNIKLEQGKAGLQALTTIVGDLLNFLKPFSGKGSKK